MKFRFFLLALAVVLPAAQALGNDVRTGYDAFRSGDYARAMEILRPLADRGDARAQYLVSAMYFEGAGVPADESEAVKWVRMSAVRGFVLAEYTLGTWYFSGSGGTKDYARAEKWLSRAAEKGHAKAQYNLGFLLYFGNSSALWLDSTLHQAPRNPVRGYAWLSISAESGLSRAIDIRDRIQQDLTRDEETEAQQLIAEIRARIQAGRRQ